MVCLCASLIGEVGEVISTVMMVGSDSFFLAGRHYLVEGRGSALVTSVWVIVTCYGRLCRCSSSSWKVESLYPSREMLDHVSCEKKRRAFPFLEDAHLREAIYWRSHVVGVSKGETLTVFAPDPSSFCSARG
ncbi:unnamed protein product [Vicia faba]|uniref:Uncharacterized protein n=1 Tax=Vicia faba TaxID=3906 RepID=A0AAV0ZH08_VICFA|nr:unnamed protein product [Vicia faba]